MILTAVARHNIPIEALKTIKADAASAPPKDGHAM
jgi:hypothetical protein